MLYLARVIKKSQLFGNRADLKLLACRRTGQNWAVLTNDETLRVGEASDFESGALVEVDLSVQKQVLGIREATPLILNILRSSSKLEEKAKNKEKEIEEWRQSLTYQSQELSCRAQELEQGLDRAQKLGQENERLKQELEQQRQASDQSCASVRPALQDMAQILGGSQAQYLQTWLERLSTLPQDWTQMLAVVDGQQHQLDRHWQQLKADQAQISQLQLEAPTNARELQRYRQEWEQGKAALATPKTHLALQQKCLELQEDQVKAYISEMQAQECVRQRVHSLVESLNEREQVDVAALEAMALDMLQAMVCNMQQELDRSSRLLSDQQEELCYQYEAIEALRAKIPEANEFERLQLKADLSAEEERYEILNATLIGQHQILLERWADYQQHEQVLRQREGCQSYCDVVSSRLSLNAILAALDRQHQRQVIHYQELVDQVDQLRVAAAQAQEAVEEQLAAQADQQQLLKALEVRIAEQQLQETRLSAQANLYEGLLQPWQQQIQALRGAIEAIAPNLEASQAAGQVVAQIQEALRQP